MIDDQGPSQGRDTDQHCDTDHDIDHNVVTPGDPDAPAPTTHRPGDEEGPTRPDGSQRPPGEHGDD